MWDQLEDAAMETFSMSNHLSLCAVFIPPAWGIGPHLEAVGLYIWGGEAQVFFALEFVTTPFYWSLLYFGCQLYSLNVV